MEMTAAQSRRMLRIAPGPARTLVPYPLVSKLPWEGRPRRAQWSSSANPEALENSAQ